MNKDKIQSRDGMPPVKAVAFDVVETLFSLDSLRPRLASAGLDGHQLETWFASFLRDAFAMEISGEYKPFRDIAAANLSLLLEKELGKVDRQAVDHVLDGFAELDPHDDVAPAMAALHEAGIRIATLTNGSAKVTNALLQQAGVRDLVEHVISIDEIGHWKPHAAVYQSCAKKLQLPPAEIALVAAHSWDIQGARRSGFMTGYVVRGGAPFLSVMEAPDFKGETLTAVIAKMMVLE